MADPATSFDLRKEVVDAVVKNFALEEFKMLPLCSVVATSGWKQTYFDETDADLSGGLGSNVKGIPRLAAFPFGQVTWTEVNARLAKYGMDSVLSWEDVHKLSIDSKARTMLRNARAVANSVDTAIITELATTTATAGASATWDNDDISLRNPIKDIMTAISQMQVNNWDPLANGRGFIVLHPTNHMELLTNESIRNAGQFYTSAVTEKGKVSYICGLKIIVANSATENTVLLGIDKDALTWYEGSPLKTEVIEDPAVKYTIRSWQVGVPVLINNNAAYKITGC